jgi:hypothetical protein
MDVTETVPVEVAQGLLLGHLLRRPLLGSDDLQPLLERIRPQILVLGLTLGAARENQQLGKGLVGAEARTQSIPRHGADVLAQPGQRDEAAALAVRLQLSGDHAGERRVEIRVRARSEAVPPPDGPPRRSRRR